MKYIIKISAILISSAIFFGCDGFLDRYPYDEVSSQTVYTSAELAESAVVGAYSNLMYDYTSADISRLNWDAFAGVIDPSKEAIYSDYEYLIGTIQPNDGSFLTYWKRFYEGINRANDVINNIDGVADMKESLKAQRTAECKFIRAYYYYRLNSLWRGVPVYLENLAPTEYTRPRETQERVWDIIIADLTDCINCESLPDKYASNSADFGRITKGAAYALRGKVYMWKKMWPEAESDLRNVGACGYSLLTGKPYADLFKLANEKSDEMVFSIGMENISGQGNAFSRSYGCWQVAGKGGNGTFFMNTNFVDTYEFADGRPFNWDTVIPGYSSMTPRARSVYFLRNGLTDNEIKTMTDYGADMTKYLPTGNEERILQAYNSRDPRLAATVITPYSVYTGGFYGKAEDYTSRWPFRAEQAPSYDVRTKSNSYMLYSIRKYVAVGLECTDELYNPVDIPVIRYASVLLDLAEALNEQGSTSEAVPFINDVRERAGVALLNSGPAYLAVSDAGDMRVRIQNERRWELACEEQLYYDELRQGTWKEFKFDLCKGHHEVWGTPVYEYDWGGDAFELWPLPSSETEKNTNLLQNDGWL